MKVLIKILAAAMIAAACVGIMSCDMASDVLGAIDSPEKMQDIVAVEAAKENLTVQKTVGKETDKIVLFGGGGGGPYDNVVIE